MSVDKEPCYFARDLALDASGNFMVYGRDEKRYFDLFADLKVQLEAARLLTYRAAWRLNRARNVSLDASMAKLFVSESFVNVARSTLQIFGGYGYMAEYEVERVLRDALGSTIYSGTSELQRNIIASWLGL